ncbi:tetratricopeptide repeat protein [Roseateles puraquae]|jgi:tetratricopeptide (TPR) repeat protein|uniref:tetratricopeptide repeat protein n=1 Tax=Roseateles puraquae TaxID=431059 RepID=UPI0031E38C48
MSLDARAKAEALHDQALALEGQDDDTALQLYHEALLLDANRPETLYNIGLIHKYRSAWALSLDYNRRAVALAPDDEAANWNLAIAATALHEWREARNTWRRLGIDVALGDEPIQSDFGRALVRLNPNDSGEVVWGRRVCPVRLRIENVPLPDSGYRCGDLVLHDGASTGRRTSGGREYMVFNALMLHRASKLTTFTLEAEVATPQDLEALMSALETAGFEGEDWTSSVHALCKACSEGRPHEHHDEACEEQAWQPQRSLGVAALAEGPLMATLRAWEQTSAGRCRVLALAAALLPPGQQAGAEHSAWRNRAFGAP